MPKDTRAFSHAAVASLRTNGAKIALALGAAISLWLALAAWAFASPVNSSPDDNVHIGSVYCAAGEDCGTVGERPPPCFAFDSRTPGSCSTVGTQTIPDLTGIGGTHYPGGYHWVMGNLVGETVADTTRSIRLVNVTIATLLIVGSVALSLPSLRVAVTMAWLVTAVPLTLFMITSINPNSWSILGPVAAWGPTASVVLARGAPRSLTAGRSLFAINATMMALVARNESPLLIGAMALGIVLLALATRNEDLRSSQFGRRILLPGVLLGLAMVFMVVRQLRKIAGLSSVPRDEVGPWASVMSVLYELPAALGMPQTPANALGWSDTYMPAIVPILGLIAIGATLAAGLRAWSWRKSVVLLGYLVLMIVPLLYLIGGSRYVGQIRPRYVLALFVVLVAFTLIPAIRSRGVLGRTCTFSNAQLIFIGSLVAAANAIALSTTEIRYLRGLGQWHAWQNPADLRGIAVPEWWWSFLGLGPFGLWLFGTILFALAIGLGLSLFKFYGALDIADASRTREGRSAVVQESAAAQEYVIDLTAEPASADLNKSVPEMGGSGLQR